ncbi:MAG: hypothetical protein IKF83_01085 [Clostridia bacterium]|nr:hypothetical protein [Clostridia bacterium]
MSVDRAASRGNARTLKIYELTDTELNFNYDSGIDFETSTLDREVKGIAKVNAKKQYEFEENVSGHKYKIIFEFTENKDSVKVSEYDNDEEMNEINLLSNK